MLVQIYLDKKQSIRVLAYAFGSMATIIPKQLFQEVTNVQFRHTQGESFNIGVQIPVFIYAILTKELTEQEYYDSLEKKNDVSFMKDKTVN